MRARPIAPLLALALAAAAVAPVTAARGIPVETGADTDRYIVALARGAEPSAVTSRAGIRAVGARQTFRHALNGFAARLTPAQRDALRRDPSVRAVVPDVLVTLEEQLLPTGVDRAEAERSPTAGINGTENLVNADVAIIDTGIQRGHPDLNVVGGVSCVPGTPASSWDDIGTHGTHVAGIVGARDNGIGVVGMAPGVRLWAVRVFDDTHKGHLSQIICGIDWVTAQRDPADPTRPRIEAVNMSLSTPGADDGACGTTNDDLEHQAICRSVAAGITYVVAAGNQETNASTRVPAAYDEVITVGAIADFNGKPGGGAPSICSSFDSADLDDTYADFSNYGADVDIMAPGKCILSTVPGNTYDLSTGTSMATPAVAGGAALYLATHPGASPREVRSALIAAGSTDWLSSTDPDGVPQRLLDVSSFGATPGFSVALRPGVRAVGTEGGSARYAVDIVRRNGFAEPIDLKLGTLPAGVRGALTVSRSSGLDSISSSASLQVGATTVDGTYPVSLTGTAGSVTERAEASLAVGVPDTAPPVVGAPVAAFPMYGTVAWDGSTSGIPVGLRWSATDARSAVTRFDLDRSLDGGAWQNVPLASATTTSLQVSLLRGHRYAYRVSAEDAAGNRSPEAAAAAFEPVPHQETSSAVTYSSGWSTLTSSSAWGGTFRTTRTKGAWARFTFTGRAIAIIAPRGTGRGRAEILIDGNVVGSVDLTSRTGMVRRVVFTRTWTSNATHVLVIRNLATEDRPRFDLDGLVFLR